MLALARMIHPASGRRACWRVLATSFTITSWRTKALRGAESRQGGRFVCPGGGKLESP